MAEQGLSSGKAPDAFRTISEVAEELDLPQHVLRFWETRFSQIKPMKRGGGRRYYRPEDVDLLRGIRLLLYAEGFTIRGVQRLLKEKGLSFVTGVGQAGSVQTVTGVGQAGSVQTVTAAEREGAVPPSGARRPAEPSRLHEPDFDADTAGEPQSGAAGTARATVPVGSPPVTFALARDARRNLESVLAELVEAKRMLDQVR